MSTIKSSDEHLTLNADGSSKDIKFQANGVEKASISSAGAFTSTTIDATKLTGDLPAISGANLTGVGVAGITSSADGTAITIDSSENVGIGTTPESGQGSNSQGLYVGTHASVISNGAYESVSVSENAYLGTAANDTWKYRDTSHAARHEMKAGVHTLKVAASGTADADITWTDAMTIDNNGYVTMPNQPSIVLGGSTGGYATVNSGSVAPFNNIETQTGGSNYNTSTYRYTAPVAGWYQVTFHALSQSEIEQEWLLRKNANTVRRHFQPTDSVRCWSFSTQVYCAVNDYLDIESNTSNSNNIYMSSGGNMYSWVSYRLLG